MPETELYDIEENQVYKFSITQENYDNIIGGDLQLASKLFNDQKVKKKFVAAFEIMKQASNVITEQQHNLSAPSTSGLGLENENSEIEEAAEKPTESMGENDNEGNTLGKIWTRNSTNFFIVLCKKYDKDFETEVKKFVWTKIAKEMSQKFNQKFTGQQCDTKFKVLKNMYKQVKEHNDQSGNNRKKWEYYDLMEEIMFFKPKICARATCSSISGLTVNCTPCNVTGISGKENTTISDEGDNAGSSSQFVSSFTSKRKHFENKADKRHKDKMQRQDRYLDLLERPTTVVERNEFFYVFFKLEQHKLYLVSTPTSKAIKK